MHSGTTLQQSVTLGPQTRTQHKWLVSSFVVLLPALKFNLLQGELAHYLVKRLYGLTNKKDAAEQITIIIAGCIISTDLNPLVLSNRLSPHLKTMALTIHLSGVQPTTYWH